MTSEIEKNEEEEKPIPHLWRPTIYEIVEALKLENFYLTNLNNVSPLDDQESHYIERSIKHYGDPLISLTDETWDSSIYRWMETHWELMVDLFTVSEGRSDLVLFLDVKEKEEYFIFEVTSVHVP